MSEPAVEPLASPPLATPWVPIWPLSSGVVGFAIPVQLAAPRVTTLAGNAFYSVLGLTAWDAGHWEFVRDVEGRVYGTVAVPPGTATVANLRMRLAANATAGITRMSVKGASVADGQTMNPAALAAIGSAQDVTVPATAYLAKEIVFPISPVPAPGSLLLLEIIHEGAHANDTLAANTLLFGAWLELG